MRFRLSSLSYHKKAGEISTHLVGALYPENKPECPLYIRDKTQEKADKSCVKECIKIRIFHSQKVRNFKAKSY
jgi:hypothetical protein